MPLLFLDRVRRADDYPWLAWKVRFFAAGAALALGGIMLQIDWIVMLATGILVAGFFLRFLPSGKGVTDHGRDEENSPTTNDH
ncbi:MAG: hypothetical protein WD056_02730 [Gemmatimonadota bacterium]